MGDAIAGKFIHHPDNFTINSFTIPSHMDNARGVSAHHGANTVKQCFHCDCIPSKRDFAVLAHADDDWIFLIYWLRRAGLRKVNFDALSEQRRSHHEDDEQHQHDVNQRRDVDIRKWLVKVIIFFKASRKRHYAASLCCRERGPPLVICSASSSI